MKSNALENSQCVPLFWDEVAIFLFGPFSDLIAGPFAETTPCGTPGSLMLGRIKTAEKQGGEAEVLWYILGASLPHLRTAVSDYRQAARAAYGN